MLHSYQKEQIDDLDSSTHKPLKLHVGTKKTQTKPKIKTHKKWFYFFNCKDSLNSFVLVEATSLVAWTKLYTDEHEALSVDI